MNDGASARPIARSAAATMTERDLVLRADRRRPWFDLSAPQRCSDTLRLTPPTDPYDPYEYVSEATNKGWIRHVQTLPLAPTTKATRSRIVADHEFDNDFTPHRTTAWRELIVCSQRQGLCKGPPP